MEPKRGLVRHVVQCKEKVCLWGHMREVERHEGEGWCTQHEEECKVVQGCCGRFLQWDNDDTVER